MAKSSERAERMQKAAAQLAAQKQREKRRNLLMILGVVVAMVVIVGGGALIASLNGGGAKTPQAGALPSGTDAASIGLKVGPDTAPHKVVIYEDFICPFCGMFEQASHTELASLAAAGKVQLDYRPFHFLPEDYSEQALEVFEAVKAQGNATVTKAFHDALYANQPSETGPYPSQSDIIATAVKAGADKAAIEKALSDGSAKTAAKAATTDAGNASVQHTPTILLDGKEFTSGATVQQIAANLVQALS